MVPVSGVLVVDKPEGPTSHDVVARVRRLLRTKAGHTGTLDPFASGVLPVLCGRATRLMRFYQGEDKVYRATLQLGVETTTYDREGAVTATSPVPSLRPEKIEEILRNFTGSITQIPPMFSAIRVEGERLYKIARQGREVDRPPREITIHALDLIESTQDTWTLEVHCSAGTYIRSLAYDLGRTIGCGAYLRSLVRLACGEFELGPAVSVEDSPEAWLDALIPLEEMLPELPRVELEAASLERVRHGNPIRVEIPAGPVIRLFGEGRLVAIAERRQGSLQPVLVF